ncbi:MAG: hypothetical protein KGJ01_03765, partial [Patescibacteria group bacterium]|nr:hypothetical protein [Patescibacteria group bacterium]
TASGGNKSLAEEGRKWITAAISGIVMLIVAYIVLNTINPAVFKLEGFSPPSVSTTTNSGLINIATGPVAGPADAQSLAGQILNNPNITIDSSGECDSASQNPGSGSSNPLANIQDSANSLLPYVCAEYSSSGTGIVGSCDCTRGGPTGNVSLNPQLLSGLLDMANSGFKFDITSLTTGIHGGSCDSSGGKCFPYGEYHGHYSGEAVDLVPIPTPTTPSQWISMRNEISSINSTYCNTSQSVFYCESGSTVENGCQAPTDHIHWTCAK